MFQIILHAVKLLQHCTAYRYNAWESGKTALFMISVTTVCSNHILQNKEDIGRNIALCSFKDNVLNLISLCFLA